MFDKRFWNVSIFALAMLWMAGCGSAAPKVTVPVEVNWNWSIGPAGRWWYLVDGEDPVYHYFDQSSGVNRTATINLPKGVGEEGIVVMEATPDQKGDRDISFTVQGEHLELLVTPAKAQLSQTVAQNGDKETIKLWDGKGLRIEQIRMRFK